MNEEGKRQAKAAGEALKNVRFDKAYSSDLIRTQETCRLILEQNAVPESNLSIDANVLIKEQSFGVLENTLASDLFALAKKQGVGITEFVPEGGESREEVKVRGRKFLLDTLIPDVRMDPDQPHVLMVSHGVFLFELFRVLFEELGCKPPNNTPKEDLKKWARNTSWSRFQFEIDVDTLHIKDLKCLQSWTEDHLHQSSENVCLCGVCPPS